MAVRRSRASITPDQAAATPSTPTKPALLTKSAQDAQALMASVTAIRPEWREAADAIAHLYRVERQDGRTGYLGDPGVISAILAGIDAGSTPQQAGVAIGVAAQTITNWLVEGERHAGEGRESARRLFWTSTQRAKERRRQRLLQRVEAAGEAGPQYWVAPAWLLERGYGGDYKLTAQQLTGNVVVNVGIISAGDVRVGVGVAGGESPRLSEPITEALTVSPIESTR